MGLLQVVARMFMMQIDLTSIATAPASVLALDTCEGDSIPKTGLRSITAVESRFSVP